ncbi:MAG TPA: AsmA family protein, partial [Gammaproteobacteria bacterium]|nr:AsmA family protein [Gammaproteobacteria bacterium]
MAITLKIVKWSLSSAAAILAALILLAIFINWNWVTDYAARKISEQTDRKFTIGNLDVDLWSLRPHLQATKIRFENAPWGRPPQMVKLGALETSIDLIQLIKGRVVIPELIIDKPVVHLETSKGKANWRLTRNKAAKRLKPAPAVKRGQLPAIGKLVIHDGQITYHDPDVRQAMTLAIANIAGSTFGPGGNVTLNGRGRLQGQRWRLDFNAGALEKLVVSNAPYPVHLRLAWGDTRARVNGKLMKPIKLAAGKLNFSLQGPGLKMLSSFLGPIARRLPAYDVEGSITRAGQTWHVRDFRAEVGKSDLAGDIGINTSGKLPFIKADLVSHRLDYADFQTVMGAKYGNKNANSAEQLSKKGAARTAGESPEPLFNLGPLQKFNAQVSFKGENVIAPNLPLEDVALAIALQDGRLAIEPFSLGVAGGDIRSQVQLDSSGQPAHAALQAEVNQVNLKEIVRGSRFAQKSVGNIGGRAHLNAT